MSDKQYTEEEKQKALENGAVLIDIDKVIEDKSPALKKMLPGFVTGWMKRIIRREFLNTLLVRHGHLTGTGFIDDVLKDMNTKLEVAGLDNIPEKAGMKPITITDKKNFFGKRKHISNFLWNNLSIL